MHLKLNREKGRGVQGREEKRKEIRHVSPQSSTVISLSEKQSCGFSIKHKTILKEDLQN